MRIRRKKRQFVNLSFAMNERITGYGKFESWLKNMSPGGIGWTVTGIIGFLLPYMPVVIAVVFAVFALTRFIVR